jgi:L-malate glycosyltransferase
MISLQKLPPKYKRVLIVQSQMKQYRVPFYEGLFELLKSDGIELRVAYSDPSISERRKKDNSELPKDFSRKVPGYWLLRDRILYQPVLREIAGADLVIVEYANKHVVNHILLLLRCSRAKRLAFWGLGGNKQTDSSCVSEWYKRLAVKRADWYFAYTRGVADEVAGYGMPAERISAVQNAVDTRDLQNQMNSISSEELDTLRQKLGIKLGDPVGVYCGMLEAVKSVPFLIACANRIKKSLPKFHLLIVGGGQDESKVRLLAQENPWIHVLGPKFGRDKALTFKAADVFLLPGRVGLAILDCFAAHLPLMTVKLPIHGPEAEYLQNGVNGFMVEQEVETYAACVVRALQNPELLQRLKEGAQQSAQKYSIQAMVQNFHEGIIRCLSTSLPATL